MRDPYQLAPAVAFLHLTVDQPRRHLPTFALSALDEPLQAVQPLSVVDKSDISPNRLTVFLDSPYPFF
jgi:hypothetical protein